MGVHWKAGVITESVRFTKGVCLALCFYVLLVLMEIFIDLNAFSSSILHTIANFVLAQIRHNKALIATFT